MVDHDVSRVLQMNPIGVEAAAWRSDCDVVDLNCFAVVELEMALLAVLDCDAGYCHIVAPVESQGLQSSTHDADIYLERESFNFDLWNGMRMRQGERSHSRLNLWQIQAQLIMYLSKASSLFELMESRVIARR